MSFIADKQTLEDLNLLGKYKPHSIYSLFNVVKTNGGERLLQQMFENPLTDAGEINRRSSIFQYFQNKPLTFPLDRESVGIVENYFALGTSTNRIASIGGVLRKKASAVILRDEEFERMELGLFASIQILRTLKSFWTNFGDEKEENSYLEEHQTVKAILLDTRLTGLLKSDGQDRFSIMSLAQSDYLLRHLLKEKMQVLLEHIYRLDVYIAVAEVARESALCFAKAFPRAQNCFRTTALWHPSLKNPISNPLAFNKDLNLLFLTGANMAGKSTLMKAFGISVYLAHMGFPVAAADMEFSVKDGIYSSVNVSDDLNLGLSHFYAEVLRVKRVAEAVASGKDLIVIFDELFKGTNVKDAYDGTLSVTQAFARYRNCFFIVSTHIIEVGEALKEKAAQISLSYLPTVMEGNIPKYTYKLATGISADRQGMLIIRNEGILELIGNSAHFIQD
jgi:DNA mismatch repair protein MutS